jgi:hypothetical protein
MPALRDLTGMRFGRLLVLNRASNDKHGNVRWLCRCQCSAEKAITRSSLARGSSQSCGCLQRELAQEARRRNPRHGHAARNTISRTYTSWQAMLQRCYNPKKKGFQDYGGLGVTVCDHWRHSFENFLADMGERPTGKTLDRWPNPYGNYEPDNCQWSTPKEQQAHRKERTKLTVAATARMHGVIDGSIRNRIRRHGETVAQAIAVLSKSNRKKPRA